MRRVSAADARKDLYRLLDEVAAGEVVMIPWAGVECRIERLPDGAEQPALPDYSDCIRVTPDAERADTWAWTWRATGDVVPL